MNRVAVQIDQWLIQVLAEAEGVEPAKIESLSSFLSTASLMSFSRSWISVSDCWIKNHYSLTKFGSLGSRS